MVQDVGSVGSVGLDSWERPLWRETRVVCGVDEAGRGPLAGPVPWTKSTKANENQRKSTKGGNSWYFGFLQNPSEVEMQKRTGSLFSRLAMFSHV